LRGFRNRAPFDKGRCVMSKSHAATGWASDAPTPAQIKEFFAQIGSGRITKGRLQAFLRGEADDNNVQKQKDEWAAFYQKYFGLDCDFSQLRIPKRRPGFDRLIVVAKGLTLNQVYGVCSKHFPCWRCTDDLDEAIPVNDRKPDQAYAIWVRDRKEADEELKNLSADQLTEQGIPGITLLERMLYESKYWDETGEHLDRQNWTLCSGSRDAYGYVPYANWGGDGFEVDWYCSSNQHGGLRARAAVS
jgi:hypothetical protein